MNNYSASTLTATIQTKLPEQEKTNNVASWIAKHHIFISFFFLLLIEICTFGPLVHQMGIYLDEWSSFYKLHFCHQTFWDC